MTVREGTPLTLWLKKHGLHTVEKYQQLLKTPNGTGPIEFQGETPAKKFKAYIDVDNELSPVDKMSQVSQWLMDISMHCFLCN